LVCAGRETETEEAKSAPGAGVTGIDEECPAPVIEVVEGREDLTQVTVSKVP
jgi:hypothetical protein